MFVIQGSQGEQRVHRVGRITKQAYVLIHHDRCCVRETQGHVDTHSPNTDGPEVFTFVCIKYELIRRDTTVEAG